MLNTFGSFFLSRISEMESRQFPKLLLQVQVLRPQLYFFHNILPKKGAADGSRQANEPAGSGFNSWLSYFPTAESAVYESFKEDNMKNIEAILKDAGVELTEEQQSKVAEGIKENYKTIVDWQKQVDKAETLKTTLDETQEALKKFDGIDAEALTKQIEDLTKQLADKDTEYQQKMADRDFNDMIGAAIADARGKNAKAITALLDIEALKASKNQKEDVVSAIKALTEAEDSKMLFGAEEPKPAGKGDPIGTVKKDNAPATETLSSALAEHYRNLGGN